MGAPGPYDRASYIRNLGDIAQAQKRQALDLFSQSEWASAMLAKAQQEDTAHAAAQFATSPTLATSSAATGWAPLHSLHSVEAAPAASSQQVVPMVGPGGQIIYVLVPHHDAGGNMYAGVGNSYAQHMLIPAHVGAHPGGAHVAYVDAHGNAVATGGAGVSMAATHQMHAVGAVPMMRHPAQQHVIMSGQAGVQLGAGAAIQHGGVIYHGGVATDATGTQTTFVGAPPSGHVLVPVETHSHAQQPEEAQARPVFLSTSHPAD